MTSNTPRPTRSEQREAARAKAKSLREQNQKSERRKRIFIQLGIVSSVLLVAGTVAFTIANSSPQSTSTPVNATQEFGFKVGADLRLFTPDFQPVIDDPTVDVAEIVVYVDYSCGGCALFENANSDQIRGWVSSGVATFEVRPIKIRLDVQEYNDLATNAAVCVAEHSPDQFFDYNSKLFEAQGSGADRADLIKFAEELGATNLEKLKSCVNSNEYLSWYREASSAVQELVPGTDILLQYTPTVLVNGQLFPNSDNPALFAQFVQQASASGNN